MPWEHASMPRIQTEVGGFRVSDISIKRDRSERHPPYPSLVNQRVSDPRIISIIWLDLLQHLCVFISSLRLSVLRGGAQGLGDRVRWERPFPLRGTTVRPLQSLRDRRPPRRGF